jgi:LuxR family transcriptional regulator, quorum-sensing system regulator CviR
MGNPGDQEGSQISSALDSGAEAVGPRPAQGDSDADHARPPRLAQKAIVHIYTVLIECHGLTTLEDFKTFIRTRIRTILPHQMAVCGLGEIRSPRILRLFNIDFPTGYLEQIIRPDRMLLSSPLKGWLRERVPIAIRLDQAGGRGAAAPSLGTDLYGITSLACHGIVDLSSTVSSYFVFGQLDLRMLSSYTTLLNLIVPHLHAVLTRLLTTEHIIRTNAVDDRDPRPWVRHAGPQTHDLGGVKITERERQVLRWIAAGKSNWEIGKILSISEFTAKNHVQNLLKKLSVTGRAQAVTTAFFCGLINDDVGLSDHVEPAGPLPSGRPGGSRASGRTGVRDFHRARTGSAS